MRGVLKMTGRRFPIALPHPLPVLCPHFRFFSNYIRSPYSPSPTHFPSAPPHSLLTFTFPFSPFFRSLQTLPIGLPQTLPVLFPHFRSSSRNPLPVSLQPSPTRYRSAPPHLPSDLRFPILPLFLSTSGHYERTSGLLIARPHPLPVLSSSFTSLFRFPILPLFPTPSPPHLPVPSNQLPVSVYPSSTHFL